MTSFTEAERLHKEQMDDLVKSFDEYAKTPHGLSEAIMNVAGGDEEWERLVGLLFDLVYTPRNNSLDLVSASHLRECVRRIQAKYRKQVLGL